jgi:2-polyprenyl-3-methyl-5-hydroxy-6-metoxy-1,4-benzoquinol methylase
MTQYTILAEYYDRLNSEVDYKSWSRFIHDTIGKYKQVEENLILDLACGSGNMTVEMAKFGYGMIGIDLSVDMLMEARMKSTEHDILYLNQDMRDFELYGTVDAVICCLDSVNYLLNEDDVHKCFSLVYNYLNPSGIFIFDVNTPYKFENIYADNAYVLEIEDQDIFCVWQNSYDRESRLCDFYLNIFAADGKENGKYKRYREEQTERMYTREELMNILTETNFEILEIVKDKNFDNISLEKPNERWHFICRSKK